MTKKRTRKKAELTDANIQQAAKDLELDTPIQYARVVGPRIELHTRDAVYKWPETATEKKKRLAAKPKPKEPDPPGEPDEWHQA